MFDFEKPIDNLVKIDNKTNIIIDDYKPKTKSEYEDENGAASIFNRIKKDILSFYIYHETILSWLKNFNLKSQ